MNRVITLNWFEPSKRLEEASRLQRTEELDQQSLGQGKDYLTFVIGHFHLLFT